MEKKEFLDKNGLGTLVTQTRNAISTAKAQAISQAAADADSKVNALGVAVKKYSDDADNLIKTDVIELQEAVWPLAITFNLSPSVIRVGAAATVTASWNVKRKGADVTASSTIKLNNAAVTGTSKSLAITAAQAVAGTLTQTLDITCQGITKRETRNISVVHPSYFGTVASGWSASASAAAANDIKALTLLLNTSRACTRTGISVTNGKIVYAYPKSYGALTSVKDGNNFEVLGSYTRSEVTIDSIVYYVYVLTNPVTASGVKQIFA